MKTAINLENYYLTIVTNLEKHNKKRELQLGGLPFYNCLDKQGYEWEVVMTSTGAITKVFKTGKKFKRQQVIERFNWKKIKDQYVTGENTGGETGLIEKFIIWKEVRV